jgi:hypothetical protein
MKSSLSPGDGDVFCAPRLQIYQGKKQSGDEHQKVNNRLPDCTDATTKTINYYHKASNNVSHTQRDVLYTFS